MASFVWSIEHRDTNRFLQLLTPEAGQRVQQALSANENFWDDFTIIVGYRIVSTESAEAGSSQVDLKVQFLPGEEPVSVPATKIGNEWRLAL
jgi:hypothetical protein